MSAPLTCIGLLTLALLASCAAPEPRADWNSDDPSERIMALEQSMRSPRRADVPHVIAMLDSADPAARMLAARHLERLTGETRGYDHAANVWEREEAIDRWVAWWNEGGTGLRLEGLSDLDES